MGKYYGVSDFRCYAERLNYSVTLYYAVIPGRPGFPGMRMTIPGFPGMKKHLRK